MTNDTFHQLAQATGEIPYDDWHPVVMSLVWSWLITLTGTISSLAAVQIGVAGICAFLTCVYLYLLSQRFTVGLFGVAIFAAPHTVNLLGMIWKDSQMALAYYAGFILLLLGRRLRNWAALFAMLSLPCFVYGTLVRKNAILALLPLICFAAVVLAADPRVHKFVKGRLRKWVLSTAAIMVIFGALMFGSSVLVDGIAKPDHRSQFTQVMLDDLIFAIPSTAIKSSDAPVAVKDKLLAAKKVCREKDAEWDAYWKCYGRGADGKGFTEIANKEAIVKLWTDTMPNHVPRYIDYRLQTFGKFIFTSKLQFPGIDKTGEEHGLEWHSPRLHTALEYYVVDFGVKQLPWLYHGWFWLLASAVVIARYVKKWKVYTPELALAASSFIYIVTYFPIVPAQDYRYVYWPALAMTLTVCLLIARHSAAKRFTSHVG